MSIVGRAPAHRLSDDPRAYWNCITVAERYAMGSCKDFGAAQLHYALREPEAHEKDIKTAEVIQCLVCRRFLSRKNRKKHDQAKCSTGPYKFARNQLGSYFCYLGCQLSAKPTRANLLYHLAYEHRNDIKELNSLGFSWMMLASQCVEAEK